MQVRQSPVPLVAVIFPLIDDGHHLVGENQPVPVLRAAIRQNLVARHRRGPRVKIGAQRVFVRLVAQHEIDLLQHLHRLIAIGHSPKNIGKQPLLTLRQFKNKLVR